jgi:HKD family nuclease
LINSPIITGRVAHVQLLKERIVKNIPDVISITGGLGNKKTTELFAKINSSPVEKPLVIIATGSFIGEGFDEPRLDTLFLAMPIAWKGTLQQYTGRLHRLYENKKEVQIYDYVDVHVSMLEKMYGKRLKGYALIGYRSKIENIPNSPTDIIFDKNSFFKVYLNDIENARHNVVIVSPFITKKRAAQMIGNFDALLKRQVKVTIVTRPETDFNDKKQTALKDIFKMLEDAGVQILLKSNIHQKFVVIDNRISWYGSINLLSFGWSEESIMRLVSGNIANELLRCLNLKI